MPRLPQIAFLLSIVGLSVSLAGFSGLVAAFRRGAELRPMDAFRLRQIPEMALAAGFIALATLAVADSTGSASLTIRIGAGTALLFTLVNALVLLRRLRSMGLTMDPPDFLTASTINLATIVAAVIAVALPTTGAYEWVLVLLIARPGLAFLLALSDVAPTVAHDQAQAHDLNGGGERQRLDPRVGELK